MNIGKINKPDFRKGGRDFQAYQDLFQYHKRYFEMIVIDKDAYWFEIIEDADELNLKYKDLAYMPTMIAAVWDDFEKRKIPEAWERTDEKSPWETSHNNIGGE